MIYPQLPLCVQNDIEQKRSWEGIATPHDMAKYIAAVLALDPTKLALLYELVYSDIQPTGSDSKKLWIKTEEPVGFGIPVGGSYVVLYQYPPNTPFLWVKGEETIPAYCRVLSNGEIAKYGLNPPDLATIKWIMFEA